MRVLCIIPTRFCKCIASFKITSHRKWKQKIDWSFRWWRRCLRWKCFLKSSRLAKVFRRSKTDKFSFFKQKIHWMTLHSIENVFNKFDDDEIVICFFFELNICSTTTKVLTFLLFAKCDQCINRCYSSLTFLFDRWCDKSEKRVDDINFFFRKRIRLFEELVNLSSIIFSIVVECQLSIDSFCIFLWFSSKEFFHIAVLNCDELDKLVDSNHIRKFFSSWR